MTILFVLLAVLVVGALFLTMGKTEKGLTVRVKSKSRNTNYKAVRKPGMTGRLANHWDYYDEDDTLIEDLILIDLLFDAFAEEDWYGDYDYYVEDGKNYSAEEDVTLSEVQNEETVVEEATSTSEPVNGFIAPDPVVETPTDTSVTDSYERPYVERSVDRDFEERSFDRSYDEPSRSSSSSWESSSSDSSSSYDSGSSGSGSSGGGGSDD
jgi:uncharacterized membrane protein YgcG